MEACRFLDLENPETLFRTPTNFLDMAQAVCHSLWNTSDHLVDGVESINMKACYPASLQDYTAYEPKPEHCGAPASALASVNNDSAEPSHADPLGSHAFSSTEAEVPVRPHEPTRCSAGGILLSSPLPTAWPRR